jgi:hypothetical protein
MSYLSKCERRTVAVLLVSAAGAKRLVLLKEKKNGYK